MTSEWFVPTWRITPRQPAYCRIRRGGLAWTLMFVAVAVRTSGGQSSLSPLVPRLVLEISLDSTSPDNAFQKIADVKPSADGRIFVLDAGQRTVKVLSKEGKLQRLIGREGMGPGEFSHPTALVVGPAWIRVTDLSRQQSTTLSFDGAVQETRIAPSSVDGAPIAKWQPLRHGGVVMSTVATISSRGLAFSDLYVRVLFRPNTGTRVDTIVRYRSSAVLWSRGRDLPGQGTSSVWNVYEAGFGQAGAWAVSGDSLLAVANGETGDVQWYVPDNNGLRLVRRASMNVRSRPVTGDDIKSLEGRFRAERPATAPAGIPLRFDGIPTVWSMATRMLFASNGDLWVGSQPGANEAWQRWQVFSASSRSTNHVLLPSAFSLTAVDATRLYGFALSSTGTPVVKIFAVPPGA